MNFHKNARSDLAKFKYENHPITFEFSDENKIVNATKMAKPFGKQVGHFLALNGTKEYINILEKRYRGNDIAKNQMIREVLRVVKGELDLQGTSVE